jgi:hypothetical protein
MRVDIAYFEGYPELVAELEKFSPRARAERMRFLSALGLSVLRESGLASASRPNHSAQNEPGHTLQNEFQPLAVSASSSPKEKVAGSDMANRITKGVFGQIE